MSNGFPPKILRWCGIITEMSIAYGLEADLIAAVIWVESRGNPDAHSKSDARGLMQIVPRWHPNCKASRLYEPRYNVKCGTRILSRLINEHGMREGLGRYYSGSISSEWSFYYSLIISTMERFK